MARLVLQIVIMAKIKCVCGNVLSNTLFPNEIEGMLLTSEDLEFIDSKDCIEIDEIGRDVWECDQCGRLAINFPDRRSNTVKWYRPEDREPGGLMSFKQNNKDRHD